MLSISSYMNYPPTKDDGLFATQTTCWDFSASFVKNFLYSSTLLYSFGFHLFLKLEHRNTPIVVEILDVVHHVHVGVGAYRNPIANLVSSVVTPFANRNYLGIRVYVGNLYEAELILFLYRLNYFRYDTVFPRMNLRTVAVGDEKDVSAIYERIGCVSANLARASTKT